ncbi:MAG: type II secretion system F family protein, partial [Candidatus Omnitrophica bacterium]|nr:type II secretion system F family protein [Candidatus Omnitrophota bacterium]
MAKRLYKYTARDRSGIAVSGNVEAENIKTVSHSLKELGYVVVSIEESRIKQIKFLSDIKTKFFAINAKDILIFFRQLSAMIGAGLPLLSSLSNVIEQTPNPHFRKILINIASDIRGGRSFSEALSRHPKLFTEFHINMIKASEAGGMMGDVLERLSEITYEEQELRGKINSAFAYPILLVVISLGIVTALLTLVLPKFIGIFEETGTKLPVTTTILLFISNILRRFWFIPLGAIIFGFIYLKRKLSEAKGRYAIHKKLLSLPLFGNIILIVSVSRFCKIMGALLKSGVSLLDSLSVSQGLLGNQVLSNAVSHIRQAVIGGAPLSESFKISGSFPPMMVQMIAVGESTGKLDEMLAQIGDYYDKESTLLIRTLTTLIEPILLLVMGL